MRYLIYSKIWFRLDSKNAI